MCRILFKCSRRRLKVSEGMLKKAEERLLPAEVCTIGKSAKPLSPSQ